MENWHPVTVYCSYVKATLAHHWCYDELPNSKWVLWDSKDNNYRFVFEDSEDALKFALKWAL